jgi:hypothetical protein
MKGLAHPIEWMESPLPILSVRRHLIKMTFNNTWLFLFSALKSSQMANRKGIVQFVFPWILLSLMFTACLLFILDPTRRRRYPEVPGFFTAMLGPLRLVLLGYNLTTTVGMESFLNIEFTILDVSLL